MVLAVLDGFRVLDSQNAIKFAVMCSTDGTGGNRAHIRKIRTEYDVCDMKYLSAATSTRTRWTSHGDGFGSQNLLVRGR